MLIRELWDQDPEAFRHFLRMDIDTFDYLLQRINDNIAGNTNYRQPIPSRERLAVTLRYLATGKTSCANAMACSFTLQTIHTTPR